jgi:hypothetical protein
VLVISMPGKEVLECHSGLHPSEKEILEWWSGTFHHKSTPMYSGMPAGKFENPCPIC